MSDYFYHYVLVILSHVQDKFLLTAELSPPLVSPWAMEMLRGMNVYICQISSHCTLKINVHYFM